MVLASLDGTDTLPAYAGQVGDFCDADGGPGYTLGQIGTTGSFPFCGCSAVACNISVRLNIQTDGAAFIGWSIYQQGSNVLVHQSAPVQYPANLGGATYGTVCLPDGDFYLVVTSSTGNGFGAGGGYRLETLAGQRLVDNTANFNTGSVSQMKAGGQGFTCPWARIALMYVSYATRWTGAPVSTSWPTTTLRSRPSTVEPSRHRPATRCGSTTPTVATASAASTATR